MAIIYSSDFEGYAVGDNSLMADGWLPNHTPLGFNVAVMTLQAHSGTKSVIFGEEAWPYTENADLSGSGSLYRVIAPSGRSVSVEAWAYWDSSFTGVQGMGIHIGDIATGYFVYAGGASNTNLTIGTFNTESAVFTPMLVDPRPEGAWHKVRFDVILSSVNEAGTDINADGCARFYWDDDLILSASCQRLWVTQAGWPSGENRADNFALTIAGFADDVTVRDDAVSCGPCAGVEVPIDESDPCCGSTVDPRFETSSGGIPRSLQPWTLNCAGGGVVQTAADIEDTESWDL